MQAYAQFTRERNPSLFGRLIVYLTKAPFSHARILFTDGEKLRVFHAVECGVVVEDYVPGDEILVASFPVELSCSLDHFKGIIYGSQGKKYSFLQCFLIAIGIDFQINGNGRSICSETQGQILRDYLPGFYLPGHQDVFTPKGNYRALVDYFLERGLPYLRYPTKLSRK